MYEVVTRIKFIKVIKIILIAVLIVSCRNNEERKKKEKHGVIITFQGESPETFVTIEGLPDTLCVNKEYKSKIKYFSLLDTIKEETSRFVFLNYSFGNEKLNTAQKIQNSENFEEFVFPDSGEKEVSFIVKLDKKGMSILNFVIEDKITFEKEIKGKYRVITNDLPFTRSVYVKECSSSH